ncbi:MAG: 50S ribosomal protein L22 [bacterium]|nr:50S ribosomal protein L22 [bacterium]
MAAITVDGVTRPTSRAETKYVRASAYKAREVLDLVRGKPYSEARDILTFSERGISNTIAKCLDSAVANAEHNHELDGEDLFVAACYADEGPTLKRWRPRARGRATRIRKRTCHITVILARYTEDEITARDNRMALKGSGQRTSAAQARRRRVEASRQRTAAADASQDTEATDEQIEAATEETQDEELAATTETANTEAVPEEHSEELEPAVEQAEAATDDTQDEPKERES